MEVESSSSIPTPTTILRLKALRVHLETPWHKASRIRNQNSVLMINRWRSCSNFIFNFEAIIVFYGVTIWFRKSPYLLFEMVVSLGWCTWRHNLKHRGLASPTFEYTPSIVTSIYVVDGTPYHAKLEFNIFPLQVFFLFKFPVFLHFHIEEQLST